MNINIKTTNIEMTEAIKAYVEEKVGSLEKFISVPRDYDLQAWVEIGLSTKHHQAGDIFRAEIQIRLPGEGSDKGVRTECEKDNLYAAVDEAKDEMKVKLSRLRDRDSSLVLRGARKIKELFRGK